MGHSVVRYSLKQTAYKRAVYLRLCLGLCGVSFVCCLMSVLFERTVYMIKIKKPNVII